MKGVVSLENVPFPLLPAKRVEKLAAGAEKAEKTQPAAIGGRPGETKLLRRIFQVQESEENLAGSPLRPVFPFKYLQSPWLVLRCPCFLVSSVSQASQFQSQGEGAHMEGPMGKGGSWPLLRSPGADSGASVT